VNNIPFVRDLFRFSRLHTIDLAICSTAGVLSVLWFEVLKVSSRTYGLLELRQEKE
jgi:P-type Ca2+ transporter type 2C